MSGPAYVVMPVGVGAGGAQHSEQDTAKMASAIQQSVYEKTHPEDHEEREQNGPLKEILAHQDSLYKYISWEDPIRTLCSYIGALAILLGTHYLPLTQWTLKAGAYTLGVVSVAEFVSRSFGPDTFLARLRPKTHKKVPEPTLNATLKDIHDFIQYSVVQAQRIIFGQDLDKTFAAFFGFTAMYWLIKAVSPFSLSVLGLTSLYVAPLVVSPRGRKVAHDGKLLAGDLANVAVDNGKALANSTVATAAEQSSKVRETTVDTKRRIGDAARSGKQAAVDLSTSARVTASDVSGINNQGGGTRREGKTLSTANQ